MADEDGAIALAGGEQAAYAWIMLAPRLIHPIKLLIMEALVYMEQPLSASEITALLDDPGHYLGLIDYHLKGLAEAGVVEAVSDRQGRGALERFFYFPSPARARA